MRSLVRVQPPLPNTNAWSFDRAFCNCCAAGNRCCEGQELSDLHYRVGRGVDCHLACERALDIHREVGSLLDGGAIHCRYGLILLPDGEIEAARTNWLEGFRAALRGLPSLTAKRIGEMREACAKAGVEPFEVPAN